MSLSVSSVEAAKIIFSPTLLDSFVTSLCKLIAYVSPNDWFDALRATVAIQKILSPSGERQKLVWASLEKELNNGERRSLANRIALIERHCRPRCPKDFKTKVQNRKNLDALDKHRHGIIHGKWLTRTHALSFDPTVLVKDFERYLTHLVATANGFKGSNLETRISIASARIMSEKMMGSNNRLNTLVGFANLPC